MLSVRKESDMSSPLEDFNAAVARILEETNNQVRPRETPMIPVSPATFAWMESEGLIYADGTVTEHGCHGAAFRSWPSAGVAGI